LRACLHTPTKRVRKKREADSFDDRIWQWSLMRIMIVAIGIVIAMCGLIAGPRGSIAGLMKAAVSPLSAMPTAL
jgi:hypothetical protein